jgi:hypothetical protein
VSECVSVSVCVCVCVVGRQLLYPSALRAGVRSSWKRLFPYWCLGRSCVFPEMPHSS